MMVTSTYLFQSRIDKVWESLLDPKVIARCIPGCETLDQVAYDRYEVVMSLGIGPIRSQYSAKMTILDRSLFQSFRVVLEGIGSSEFANGEALVKLVEQNDGIVVTIECDAQLGWMADLVGQTVAFDVIKVILDRAFYCFQNVIE
jgi:carbon monoxide dehydrogenase subunit G